MKTLKELYGLGVNIMEYIRLKNNSSENSLNTILASYDMQAGLYAGAFLSNALIDKFHVNFVRTSLGYRHYVEMFTDELVKEINKYEYNSILEAGVGEATTFSNLLKKLKNKDAVAKGFDISPSRIKVARDFAQSQGIKDADLFVAGLESIPFADNSFDIVYTVHAIEPNSNNEKAIVQELYRVANKYLIMVEPSYELGNEETKQNIEKYKYIKNLKATIDDLGYKLLKYELFPIGTFTNQPAVYVIQKENSEEETSTEFCCPVCKKNLEYIGGNYFCAPCDLVYPVLADIPILDSSRAIFFSRYAM